MKLVKGLLAVAATGTLAIGTSALSEEAVEATKKAPIQNLLPNSYGSIAVEHENKYNMNGAENRVTNETPSVTAMPAIGSTFFNGKFDASLNYYFTKNTEDTSVKKNGQLLYTSFRLLSTDYGYITPSTLTWADNEDIAATTQVRFTMGTSKSFETGAGKYGISFYTQPKGTLTSASSEKTVAMDNIRNESSQTEAALTKSAEEGQIVQKDPSLGLRNQVKISFTPSYLKGVKLSSAVRNNRSFTPKYIVTDLGVEGTRTMKDGYKVSSSSYTSLRLDYSVNDQWSVYNEAQMYTKGFYNERAEGKRALNWMGVSASLF